MQPYVLNLCAKGLDFLSFFQILQNLWHLSSIIRKNNTRYWLTNLRVSQSFTVMSYDPEISSNSLLGDQATEDTHPWCDVRAFFTTAPSERGREVFKHSVIIVNNSSANIPGRSLKKGKGAHEPKSHTAGAYTGFRSMKHALLKIQLSRPGNYFC